MRTPTVTNAIRSLVPEAEFVIRGGEIEWIHPSEAPVTAEQIQVELVRLIAVANKPNIVSMRQARLALLETGLLATVEQAISEGSEADKITWEYAAEVKRDDSLVVNLSSAIGLTEEQVDSLFSLGASL